MFSAFQTFGKLGALASSVARAWSPLALWPNGAASPGMWIDPSLLTASFNDYTGTTPVATPGSVADSANPVGLALDIRAGATTVSDPGNHMLQSTSAARPMESARVNLLTYTEDFGNAVWAKSGVSITANTTETTDPIGGNTADKIISTTTSSAYTRLTVAQVANTTYTLSVYAKMGNQKWLLLVNNAAVTGTWNAWFNLEDGTLGTVPPGAAAEIAPVGDGWYRCSLEVITAASISNNLVDVRLTGADNSVAVGNGDYIYGWGAQLNIGPDVPPYQSILTDGSTYSATGITPFQLYDGVDDGMATASFAAGTLINGMDCMIPVRRDSVANCVAGLYNGIADATKFFGMAESASGSGCVGSGAGTPTVWVDGVQLSGGTAVTRGTLHTALTVGDYHIIEFRGLDLSTWTAAGFGLYTSYLFNGARGDIMIYPSTASTEDKDAARQYLADKYGVTLA